MDNITKRVKYEYDCEVFTSSQHPTNKITILNARGLDGWQIVFTIDSSSTETEVYFIRKK